MNDEWFKPSDEKYSKVTVMDIVWMLLRLQNSLQFQQDPGSTATQKIPGWSGYNALVYPDTPPETVIGYCPMINGSSTEFSTIYTVMKNTQALVNSINQDDCVITFDLAIYMKAKQIQWRLPDEFSNVVIRLGGFHIALNYLSLLGKKFSNSGIEDLLIESGVYGAGTVANLMTGKSYNRGIRAHKLAMEALFRLLLMAFFKWIDSQSEPCDLDFKELTKKITTAFENGTFNPMHIQDLESDIEVFWSLFERFKKESQMKSRLFAFWVDYTLMVLALLQFIKAERSGNWNLHLISTSALMPHFFSMDRMNYSRWLPVYIADMYELEKRHPKVWQEFTQGEHAVSRSSQAFAQVWTDMALEQSINLDSKSKGGIVGISQRPDALERWFLTSHERAAISSSLKQMCSLENAHRLGMHKEARERRVNRDEQDIQKLITCFKSGLMTDPFSLENDIEDTTSLTNIATGVVLSQEIAQQLIQSRDKGVESMEKFINERLNTDELSFWAPLPKLNIKTFRSTTRKLKAKDDKLNTVGEDRELFQRLLVVASKREINLKEVLSYELTAVPISLFHADGSSRKTTKSVLLSTLENDADVRQRLPYNHEPTAVILDGMALIQMMKSCGTKTFGEMAKSYYNMISDVFDRYDCRRIDLVFDQYLQESIKGEERQKRGESTALEVKIYSESTPVPKQWQKYIANPKNKENLTSFLSECWCKMAKENLHHNQQLVLAGGFKERERTVLISQGDVDVLTALVSDHEEADTRILLHANHASISHRRIIIHSPDTDVAVLSIAHYHEIGCNELWFRTGVKDKARFIPIHSLSTQLGGSICASLLAFHALTGCDSTCAFSGIGKKKAWKIIVNSPEHQQKLAQLGTEPIANTGNLEACEAFVCDLYEKSSNVHTADDLRYRLFCRGHKKSESLPPTSNSLAQHSQRANFQCYIWQKALEPYQRLPSPLEHGWQRENNRLQPILMTKGSAPTGILELTSCQCKKSECKKNCSCKLNDLVCTEACLCMGRENCHNPVQERLEESSDDDSSDDE